MSGSTGCIVQRKCGESMIKREYRECCLKEMGRTIEREYREYCSKKMWRGYD